MMISIENTIREATADRELLKSFEVREIIQEIIALLDKGKLRVCEKEPDGSWMVHEWIKQAILFYFSIQEMSPHQVGPFLYYDKIPLKTNYQALGVRVVPPAAARFGSFMERGVVLMPSYVNIGAWIGAGSMIDNWTLVGSCAQIGSGVHLSAGVIVGGVLEPVQAKPVIIEDGAFIGSGVNLLEGVLVEKEAVIGANVTLTSSTKIIDVSGNEPVEYKGRVPARSVVIPGSITKHFPAGDYQVSCALIIGQRKTSTDRKTSLNEVLREFAVQV